MTNEKTPKFNWKKWKNVVKWKQQVRCNEFIIINIFRYNEFNLV